MKVFCTCLLTIEIYYLNTTCSKVELLTFGLIKLKRQFVVK